MGHKVHPNAFRLGVYRTWEANWFATKKDYTKLLHEDLAMRQMIMSRLRNAGIAKIETERSSNAQMTVTIRTAKPGIVIGKGGASVDQLRNDLEKAFGNRVRISIDEIKQPELDAQLVAENIASQLERRISHRRAMKQSILRTMRAGAKGVRIMMGGRLRGSEMARREQDREGRVPLHTLRADIQFGRAIARTTFGVIGIKVWIYKDVFKGRTRGGEAAAERPPQPTEDAVAAAKTEPATAPARDGRPGGGPGGGPGSGGQRTRRRSGGRARGETGDRPGSSRPPVGGSPPPETETGDRPGSSRPPVGGSPPAEDGQAPGGAPARSESPAEQSGGEHPEGRRPASEESESAPS